MGKSSQHVTQRKQKRGRTPERKPIPHARGLRGTHKQFNSMEAIWESFPEGLIACDRYQRIARINAAARTLFEVDSETQCQGRDSQQFLTSYLRSAEPPPFVSREQWLLNAAHAVETEACSPAQALLLHLPSGHKIPVVVRSLFVGEQGRDTEGTVLVFQHWHEIPQLQRVHEATLDLLTAIAQLPEE